MRRCGLMGLAMLLAGCATVSDDAPATSASAPAPLEPPATRAAPESAGAQFAGNVEPPTSISYVADAEESGVPLEVITVIEERIQTLADRRSIYRALAKGKRLYALDQIDEAFPYLLDTAQRGFKDSQARVGHIYLQGLGDVERDATQGVGWLGAATSRVDVSGHPELLQ